MCQSHSVASLWRTSQTCSGIGTHGNGVPPKNILGMNLWLCQNVNVQSIVRLTHDFPKSAPLFPASTRHADLLSGTLIICTARNVWSTSDCCLWLVAAPRRNTQQSLWCWHFSFLANLPVEGSNLQLNARISWTKPLSVSLGHCLYPVVGSGVVL